MLGVLLFVICMSECTCQGKGVEFVAYVESRSIQRSAEAICSCSNVLYALYNLLSKKPQNFNVKMQYNSYRNTKL